MSVPVRGDRALRLAVIIGAVLLVLGGLHLTRAITAPVTFAVFIIAIVWPLQYRLERRLPRIAAAAITTLVTLLVIGFCLWLVAWGFSGITQWVVRNAGRLQALYMQTASMLEARGLYAAGMLAEQVNVLWLVRILREIAGSLQGVISFAIVTLVFVILGLLETEAAGRRVERLSASAPEVAPVALAGEIAAKLQTYMLVRGVMSVLTGLGFWIFTAVVGLELSREWGVIAFVLNFIPFIGSFVATLLPSVFAIAQFEAFGPALPIFLGLNLIQFLVGSYLEPRVAGAALAVSPFAVLFAVFFWSLLWGVAGAFIGVPILIAIVTICARFPATRGVAVALADRVPPTR